MKFAAFCTVAFVFAVCPVTTSGDETRDEGAAFRAGAVAIDITPQEFPVSSAGSMGPRDADAAHDPLHARCIVMDDGDTKLAIVVVDSCMIPREIYDEAKAVASAKTGIPTSHILTSATHTHTAVTVTPTFQSDVEEAYCDYLAERIAAGIVEADKALAPAKIGWAIGSNPNQVFNRRWYMRADYAISDPFDKGTDKVRMNPPRGSSKLLKPAGIIDAEVPVVSVQSTDGKPIAVLANYSLHYVGGVPGSALSADYFGEFARLFADTVAVGGNKPMVAMSNGASGDINNINFFESAMRQEPMEQIRLVAADVARSAKVAYDRIEYDAAPTIEVLEREIELGVRKPSAEDVEFAKKVLSQAGERPYRDMKSIYANETLHMAEYPETVQAKLQAIRIGGLAIVTTPCETFVATGLAIKEQSPFKPTFTIELANGYNGYLPTAEQHALGGYETWRAKSSYLAVDSEAKIRKTLLEMLDELAANAEE